MTFSELVSAVYLETNRPDLVTETAAAIRSAVLAAHGMDRFAPDVVMVQWMAVAPATKLAVSFQDLMLQGTTPDDRFYLSLTGGTSSVYNLVELDQSDLVGLTIREIDDVFTVAADGSLITQLEKQQLTTMFSSRIDAGTDSYRVAARMLAVTSSVEAAGLVVSAFTYPNVTAEGFHSWICEDVPYYIVHMAAAHILGPMMGKTDEAKMQQSLAQGHLPQILAQIRF